MRGSMNNQIMAAIKVITFIGMSRHQAKLAMGGQSDFIHSVGTLEKDFRRLQPLGRWLRQQGVRDLEQLNEKFVSEYLKNRLKHHMQSGNACSTFRQELSALAALERGLHEFSSRLRDARKTYDFLELRKAASLSAKQLPKHTSRYLNRAVFNPEKFLSVIEDDMHVLMARLQLEAGCRAEGVGSPRKGTNPFGIKNLCFPGTENQKAVCADPVTGKNVFPIWTKEKGGKVAMKYCSIDLGDRLKCHLIKKGPLEDNYSNYLRAINRALKTTGQHVKGKGTHALRYAFAQHRYAECVRAGFVDE